MDTNAELLNYIYQNSQMGVETLEHLLEITEDEKFKTQLQAQLKEYKEINKSAHEILLLKGCDEKGISGMEKLRTYLMINMQTIKDKSTSHIAEMLITGSTMGIVQAIKKLKEYTNANEEVRSLMRKLLEFEENNFQNLKQFL